MLTGQPKRHRFVLEVTDMLGHFTTRRLANRLKDFLKDGIHNAEILDLNANELMNVQVKDFRMVMAHEIKKRKKL
jgi:hypothetical protein